MPITGLVYGAKVTSSYEVANSLRFNDGSSDYLSFTPSSSPTSSRIATISFWFKLSAIGTNFNLFSANQSGLSNPASFKILLRDGNGRLELQQDDGSAGNHYALRTNQLFRDPSAWYHLVASFDTTQGTSSNRIKLYINGSQVTSFSQEDYPTQNLDLWLGDTDAHNVGRDVAYGSSYYDGYMAEFVYIDGQQLTPTSFGEFDEDTNIWKPINVSGLTFGNNGFYLDFENSSSLGADVSGNGNNFTVNNLTSIDQSTDTCTNNFATLNPLLDVNNPQILSNGNLTATGSGSGNHRFAGSTMPVANGKWYYEVKVTVASSSPYVGLIDSQSNLRRDGTYFVNSDGDANNPSGFAVNMSGDIYHNNSNSYATSIGSISTGDILGFAIDLDSGTKTCEIYKNGSSQRSFNLDEPPSGFYMLGCSSSYNQSSSVADMNFGSPAYAISSGNSDANGYGNFEYSVPSGYYALNSKNLAEYG